jgi:hypothetical protein
LAGVDIHGRAGVAGDHAQLVDAMHVVGMVVGVEHAVRALDAGGQRLHAQIRTTIDEHAGGAVFDVDRGAIAAVARIVRIALAPLVSQPRHAARGATAENRHFHRASPR